VNGWQLLRPWNFINFATVSRGILQIFCGKLWALLMAITDYSVFSYHQENKVKLLQVTLDKYTYTMRDHVGDVFTVSWHICLTLLWPVIHKPNKQQIKLHMVMRYVKKLTVVVC
jgi:hypothetical protein